jgi:hypothetical protein
LIADIDIVIARGEITARVGAEGRVAAAGVAPECTDTNCCVVVASRVGCESAPAPVAVFPVSVLAMSAPAPTAVLNCPVVSLRSEKKPTAVLNPPVVRLRRAFCPSAVLPPG